MSSERNALLMERQYVFITVASMGESSLVHNPKSARNQDNDIDTSSEYEGNEVHFLEISMDDNAITDETEERKFTSTDVPLKLDFFFYNIEEPEYHLAPKCNDKLLNCFRFIAQQNGTDIFCYCMSQANGRFEQLVRYLCLRDVERC
jgi:hypothetical protein